MDFGRILLVLLLYVAVLGGPWVAALRLKSVSFDAPFPTQRELTALFVALFLIPAASCLTALSGYLILLVGPVLTVSLSVFVTAVAGRRPFLYAVGVALLHITVFMLWASKVASSAFNFTYEAESLVYVLILGLVALVCGLVGGAFLFGLWRMEPQAKAGPSK